jgi:hypothetical protein
VVYLEKRKGYQMRNSTTLYRIEKAPLNRLKRIYSDKLFTLENNDGQFASVYIDNVQQLTYSGEGAWVKAQRYASMLTDSLDMGDL